MYTHRLSSDLKKIIPRWELFSYFICIYIYYYKKSEDLLVNAIYILKNTLKKTV